MVPGWVQVIGAVLVLAGSIVGAWLAARSSDRAAITTARTQHEANAIDGFHRLTSSLESQLTRLAANVESLEGRVRTLEEQLSESRRLLRSALAYVERLLDYIRDHIDADADHHPPVPPELRDHLDP